MPDVTNEKLLRREMAKALKVKPSELEIEKSPLMSFRVGDAATITVGRQEWTVVGDDDTAREIALAVVKQDLENEPEIFNPNFIERHINLDRLRRDLMSDVQNMRYEDLKEEAERRPLKFMEDNDIEIPSPQDALLRKHAEEMSDEDKSVDQIYRELVDMSPEDQWAEIGGEPEVEDSDIEKIAEQEAEAQLKDPIAYLDDIFGEDAAKKAIEIAGINIDEAAEDAVDTDGWQHFLARYDGRSDETPAGFVFWRDN